MADVSKIKIKGTTYNLKDIAARSSISNLLVDNLISTDTNKALSANQGRALNEKITAEAARAIGAEQKLTTDLANEITRAKAKENELNTKIENVESTKLDKVSTANKVYGTDGTGAQTTYDVSKLGQVDDVTYNSKSLVSNRVANLNGFLTYSDEELS